MSVSLFAVIVDSNDPEQLAQFWATTLGWDSTRRNEGEFQVSNPAAGEISLYFMGVPEPKQVKNRLHLDLLADGPMEPEVERLIERGAQLVEVREDPDSLDNPDRWTVLLDPEGNEFCVTSTTTLTGWN
jgi:predicted enzyme related to lactoylglutathione lyase